MMSDDRFADELPAERANRIVKYDWHSAVKACRERPGEWYQAFKNVPESTTATVRERQGEALREASKYGRFEVGMRNMRRRRGDLWMRFLPYTDDELRRLWIEGSGPDAAP